MDGKQERPIRVASTLVVLGTVLAALGLMTVPATAGHGPDAPGGPYNGFSHGSIFHVDAVTTETTRVFDFELGFSSASVDSEGLEKTLNEYRRTIIPADSDALHSRGHSSILEAGALLNPPDSPNQLKLFEVESAAPGGEGRKEEYTIQPTDIATAAHVSVLRRLADAKWNNDTCVIGEPVSEAAQHVARAEVIELGADDSTPASEGFDGALAGVDASSDGPNRAAANVISREQLFKGDGDGLGLQSVSTTTLAPVTFFEGTENEFRIEVDGPSHLSATADGTSGGANVDFQVPLVSVKMAGNLTLFPDAEQEIRIPPTGDQILARIRVGTVHPLDTAQGLTGSATEADNGTAAGAQANVVEVTLLDVPGSIRGATVALGHMESATQVPPGGISCPIPVSKDANPDEVTVGDLFTTTITVENKFACPITGLSIEDVITTSGNAEFEVIEAPKATSIPGGSGLTSGTVDWGNLGTLDPGEKISVKVMLEAQGGAGRIIDTASADGTLTNCKVTPGGAGTDVSSLTRAKVDVDGSARLVVPATQVLGKRLAKTGVADRAWPIAGGSALILLAAMIATAYVVRARRATA